MPKMTLLEVVQDILNDMNSDEVNSINDTIEATQVSYIVKNTYYELIHGKDWPHLRRLMVLDGVGDTSKPNYMKLPTVCNSITTLRYNKRKTTDTYDKYEEVRYLDPQDFIRHTVTRNSSNSNIITITDFSGVKLFIFNDRAPTYWTSFDNDYIVFDSYDVEVDSTLQSSKTQVYASVEPTWTIDDDFIPDLPAEAFSLLVAESKSTAFNALKQVPNQKEEQKSTRQRRRISSKKSKVVDEISYKSFGRR